MGCDFYILFGDPEQMEPFADEAIEDDSLVDQVTLLLFTRLGENGRSHTRLLGQRRMVEDIGELASGLTYGWEPRHSPLTSERH